MVTIHIVGVYSLLGKCLGEALIKLQQETV